MSGSSFGTHFRVTTFGESHGLGVGVIVDGVTPGLSIDETDVQKELNRRKPGQSDITTPREEQDKIQILSGIFEGKTTGTPVGMVLYNKDADPSAYESIKHLFRPGHADCSYIQKYGFRDWRGSGRASGRETVSRVAAGAFAKKSLQKRGVVVTAFTKSAGGIECEICDMSVIEKNVMRAPDMQAAEKMLQRGMVLKEQNNSMGGVIECHITGLIAGLGEPVFDKLDAILAHAVMSIGAIKGFEVGAGFRSAMMTGFENNDQMNEEGFITNNAGGILGGISTGESVILRMAVKPPSSIALPQQTKHEDGTVVPIKTEGRHDVCICPRVVPVVEAMCAIVLEDMYKTQAALHM